MQILVRYGLIPQVVRCPIQADLDLQRGDAVLLRTSRGLELGTVLERVATRPPGLDLATTPAAGGTAGGVATLESPPPPAHGDSALRELATPVATVNHAGDRAQAAGGADAGDLHGETAEAASAAPAATGCQFERIATADDVARAKDLRLAAEGDFAKWQQRFGDWRLELELLDLEWTFDRSRLIVYVLGGRGAETTRLSLLAAAAGAGPIEVAPVSTEGLLAPEKSSGGGCSSGGCGCRK